jgi:hypothetical protein
MERTLTDELEGHLITFIFLQHNQRQSSNYV